MPREHEERQKADRTELVPEAAFKDALKKVLATSKEESDRQLAEFQASNKAKREERSHRKAKPKS